MTLITPHFDTARLPQNWNGSFAGFDIDGTLVYENSGFNYVGYCLTRRPLQTIWNLGIFIPKTIFELSRMTAVHVLGGEMPPERIIAFGSEALRRLTQGLNAQQDVKTWWAFQGRQILNEPIVEIAHQRMKSGVATAAITSQPLPIAQVIADDVGIPFAIGASVELDEKGAVKRQTDHPYGRGKIPPTRQLLAALDKARSRQTKGAQGLRAIEHFYDSPSDTVLEGKATVVGTRLRKFLRKNGGRQIIARRGGCIRTDVRKFRNTGRAKFRRSARMERYLFPTWQRFSGLGLIPLQWLVGDILSEGKFSLAGLQQQAGSFFLFAGAGSIGEWIARGLYNKYELLPTFFAGEVVRRRLRGFVVGAVSRFSGSLLGMTAMGALHTSEPISRGSVVGQAAIHTLAWTTSRFVILGAFAIFRAKSFGRLFEMGADSIKLAEAASRKIRIASNIAEMGLAPIFEFSLMKQWNDWNYRSHTTLA